jgi:hypothetical protein
MKKLFAVAGAMAIFGGVAWHARSLGNVQAQNPLAQLSRAVGVYNSQAYAGWGMYILSGNTATGSQTITVCPAYEALPDGRVVQPLAPANSVYAPITVDAQSSAVTETVTPTAYSLVAAPAGASGTSYCANVTATFANLHGSSYNTSQVISGDQGIQEAINDASLNGGGLVYWQADTGNVTLNTGALTTTTAAQVPTNFISMGASGRVTTTITTSANWAVGISGSTSAFCTANSTLTSGTTCIANLNAPARVGNTIGLTPIVFTMGTSNPGAGAIHARAWGYTPVQSNF